MIVTDLVGRECQWEYLPPGSDTPITIEWEYKIVAVEGREVWLETLDGPERGKIKIASIAQITLVSHRPYCTDSDPAPPGPICPFDGSVDVDIDFAKKRGYCNSCGVSWKLGDQQ